MAERRVFEGHIAGIGASSGLRAVVGLWQDSPFGPFADAMVELPSGHRILLAPTARIRRFIAGIYTFDKTVVLPVAASLGAGQFTLDAGPLQLRARVGARTGLGAAVRPAVRFGSSSVPPEPALVRVRTTVERAPAVRR